MTLDTLTLTCDILLYDIDNIAYHVTNLTLK